MATFSAFPVHLSSKFRIVSILFIDPCVHRAANIQGFINLYSNFTLHQSSTSQQLEILSHSGLLFILTLSSNVYRLTHSKPYTFHIN